MSKTLLKLAGITALVFAGLYLFIFVIVHLAIPYNYLADNMYDYAVLLVMAVLSLISAFGGILFLHYKDLSNEGLTEKKGFILAWSIVFLITSGIAGILGFAAYVCLFGNIHFDSKIDYIEEIKELKKLKEKGLITEQEFTSKKKKILDI